MPTPERLKAYVAMVNEGRYVDAIREFYHEDAAMYENQKPPRVGRERQGSRPHPRAASVRHRPAQR